MSDSAKFYLAIPKLSRKDDCINSEFLFTFNKNVFSFFFQMKVRLKIKNK